jgi:Nucleoside-diphosphate-sugar epimerases
MSNYIIFGGSGYIGTKLTEFLLNDSNTEKVFLADIKISSIKNEKVVYIDCDVRNKDNFDQLPNISIDRIFNFAAIHREPGHDRLEYYETNIKGAENVCSYAEKIGCKNILFTSSISVYGPTLTPTDEYKLTTPDTPYGISKLTAEYIHREWLAKTEDRKLVIVRPGVVYGPGDPGNILRMIKAVEKGYFFLPTTPQIKKSYAYVFGLIDSFVFAMNLPDKLFIYNYVEKETESLGEMIKIINTVVNKKTHIIRLPFKLVQFAAFILYKINPNLNGVHPARVKKVARPTHIIPKVLIEKDFKFNYDFLKSLYHWKQISPNDF